MMRFDRALTLGVACRLKRSGNEGRRPLVPILMYHGIRERLDGRHPYYETGTSPAAFERQMRFLREHGYESMDPGQAVEALAAGAGTQRKVVITFDDGFRDFYTQAFPVLRRHALSATVFLPTGRIGRGRRCLDGREYLTWGEVRELHARGIGIGSHTVTHTALQDLPENAIDRELGESRRAIEGELGAAVTSFACPYAFPESDRPFVRRLARLLEKHGYQNGVTTIVGRASAHSPRYSLPRLPINDWDDERLFEAKLRGGYDWLHAPQFLSKAARGLASLRPLRRAMREEAAG